MLSQFAPPATVAQLQITCGQLGRYAEVRGATVLARRNQFGGSV
jgi:hypothetical protein